MNLTGTEASNLYSRRGADEENRKDENKNGKKNEKKNEKEEKRSGKRAWQTPLTAFAISSAPLLLAEEKEEKVKKVVSVPHLNAEEKRKASEEKKMIMGKSQEDRIRLDPSCCQDDNEFHGRQYATADNVFDYFANYQVISESGQYTLHLPGTL